MAFFKSLVDKIRQGFDKGLEKTREAFIGGVQGLQKRIHSRAVAGLDRFENRIDPSLVQHLVLCLGQLVRHAPSTGLPLAWRKQFH